MCQEPGPDPGVRDDYQGLMVLEMGRGIRCRVCRTLHAPGAVCGYCRGRVKAIRKEKSDAEVS